MMTIDFSIQVELKHRYLEREREKKQQIEMI